MCFYSGPGRDLTVELTAEEVRAYREALTAILAGDGAEPHMRTLREINVRLGFATRRPPSQQEP